MKFKPADGWLVLSPIEEPNEKHFIEVVGMPTSLTMGVVERSGSTKYAEGDVVYYPRGSKEAIILEQSVVFDLTHESQARGVILAADVGEVKRMNISPGQAKAMRQKQAEDVEAANRRAALEAGLN